MSDAPLTSKTHTPAEIAWMVSRLIHDECENVPHDIGLKVMALVNDCRATDVKPPAALHSECPHQFGHHGSAGPCEICAKDEMLFALAHDLMNEGRQEEAAMLRTCMSDRRADEPDEDHVCGVCEGTQRGVCNCKCAQPAVSPPQESLEDWVARAAADQKRVSDIHHHARELSRLTETWPAEPPDAAPFWSLVDEYLQSHSLNNNERGVLRAFAGWADTGRQPLTKDAANRNQAAASPSDDVLITPTPRGSLPNSLGASQHSIDAYGDCINPGCTYPSVGNLGDKCSAHETSAVQCTCRAGIVAAPMFHRHDCPFAGDRNA